MGLFRNTTQRITISSADHGALEDMALMFRAENTKGIKISAVERVDDESHCMITCKSAEPVYYQKILPLINDSTEAQSFSVTLELDDSSEPARRCPNEILASFGLKSQYAFGDAADHEFVQDLRQNIVHGKYVEHATVSYYIVAGGAITMSIPCLDLQGMEDGIKHELESYGAKRFTLQVVERERA